MSDMRPDIDLAALARPEKSIKPPRRFKPIHALPLVILVVFLALLGNSLRDLFQARISVTLIRPQAVQSVTARPGAVVLQAAGWVEPDPFPIAVTALVEGVVEEVLVRESDAVRKGQVVATLVDVAARAEVRQAKARLAQAQAAAALADVQLKDAQERFQNPVLLREALAAGRAKLKEAQQSASGRDAALKVRRARARAAEANWQTQKLLLKEGAAGDWQVRLARAELDQALAAVEEAAARLREAEARVEVERAHLVRAQADLELRLDDRLRLASAAKEALRLEASSREAQVLLERAEQRLAWCRVRAPRDGFVLERLAMPGTQVGGRDQSGTVCTLHEPSSLRLRVDVPQSDMAKVALGQEVTFVSSARRESYRGRVQRILHRADIQKVTLEVQVKVLDGDALLRPEMLCQVRFLASSTGKEEKERATAVVSVPKRLIVSGKRIWVLDALGERAILKDVILGADLGDQVEVLEGVNPSDKLIDQGREELKDGQAVQIRGEK